MEVASARRRAASAAPSPLDVEGRGAPKYLRRGRDFAGDVLSLMVGCRGTGRFAHEQLRDRIGQGFVVGCARPKSRCEEAAAKLSSATHAAAVAPGEGAQYVGSRSRCLSRSDPARKLMLPLTLEEAIFFHDLLDKVKPALQALRTALRRCDSRTRLGELYRNLRRHFFVRPTSRRRGAKD